MMYKLPKSLEVCGHEYEIRSDYRAVLDICAALSDPELDGQGKGFSALDILYPGFLEMPQEHYEDALKQCFWFINCGGEENSQRKAPKLVDWEKDFKLIVAPVNRVIGREVRAVKYMHWWTFISAYYEIGDCLFAQVVRIREKKATGKKMDKSDRDFYKKNRNLVDFKVTYTDTEQGILKEWGV